MANVLVVVAHADDEVLGCGATLAKHADNGDEITLLVLTDGVGARKSLTEQHEKEKRHQALINASELIGIKQIIQCDFPDNKMDTIALLDIVQSIESHCVNLFPSIIYTHSETDLNIDHRITAQAVNTAFRPIKGSSVNTILAFEVLSSTEWRFFEQVFKPNWFVNIDKYIAVKVKALACYQEELREFPHPRSLEGVDVLAKFRGMSVGYQYAEAFSLVRHFPNNS